MMARVAIALVCLLVTGCSLFAGDFAIDTSRLELCDPGSWRCGDLAELDRCTDDGMAWQQAEQCYSKAYCDAKAGVCLPNP